MATYPGDFTGASARGSDGQHQHLPAQPGSRHQQTVMPPPRIAARQPTHSPTMTAVGGPAAHRDGGRHGGSRGRPRARAGPPRPLADAGDRHGEPARRAPAAVAGVLLTAGGTQPAQVDAAVLIAFSRRVGPPRGHVGALH